MREQTKIIVNAITGHRALIDRASLSPRRHHELPALQEKLQALLSASKQWQEYANYIRKEEGADETRGITLWKSAMKAFHAAKALNRPNLRSYQGVRDRGPLHGSVS